MSYVKSLFKQNQFIIILTKAYLLCISVGRVELNVADSLIGGGKKPARIPARWDWQRKKPTTLVLFDITVLASNFKIPVCRVQFSLFL